MTSPVTAEQQKGTSKASSEKVAMTSPVTAEMEGGKYVHIMCPIAHLSGCNSGGSTGMSIAVSSHC